MNKEETELWKEYQHEGVCSLCFGTGIIPPRRHRSIRGDFDIGKQPCICPDGRYAKHNLLAHLTADQRREMGF